MDDLKGRTIRGGVAKLFGQAANFVLRLGFIAVMARLLDPKDFGLVAMVMVVTGIYELFTTAGLSAASVQKETISNEQISTLFWVNLLVGVVLGLLCVLTAPLLVAFYGEPRLFWATVVMGIGFVANAAGVQHYALLQRELRYVAITAVEILSHIASIVIAVAMALAGYGYWALVMAYVSTSAVMTVLMWGITGWVPKLPSRNSGVGSMLQFGATVTLNSLVVYVAYNLDKVLLGRFWGADALGLYSRAYQLINIPTTNLNAAVGGVAFSALSRLQGDPVRFKNYFLKSYTLVISLTMPLAVLFALLADDIILVILGPKWTGAADILRLMAPTVMIFGIINPLGWLLWSNGLQVRSLLIAFAIVPVVCTGYTIGLSYGPKGVALGYSAAMALWLVPHVLWCLHKTIVKPGDFLAASYRPFAASLLAAAVVLGAKLYFDQLDSAILRLILGSSLMAAVYLLVLLFVMGQKALYIDLLKGLKSPTRPA